MENKTRNNNDPSSEPWDNFSITVKRINKNYSPKRLKKTDQTTLKILYLFFKALQLNKTQN